MEYQLSDHAAHRAAQRNLMDDEIDFMLQFGFLLHNTGVIFCQLRAKDLPDDLPRNHRYRRLVGSTLVLCKCGHYVVTLYRENRAFHSDSCKVRYNLQKSKLVNCPYCHTEVA